MDMTVILGEQAEMTVSGMRRVIRVSLRIGIIRQEPALECGSKGVQQRRPQTVREFHQLGRKHLQRHHQPVVTVYLDIKIGDDVVVRHPALREVMVLVGNLLQGIGQVKRKVLLLRVKHQRQLIAALDQMHQFLVLPVILRLECHLVALHLKIGLAKLIAQHLERLCQVLLIEHRP